MKNLCLACVLLVASAPAFAHVEVTPSSFTLVRGILVSGGLAELAQSDEQRMVLRPGWMLNSGERPIKLVLEGTSPIEHPSDLRIRIESQADTPNIEQRIEAFNFVTNEFTLVDSQNLRLEDSNDEFGVPNPAEHVGPGGALKMRVSYKEAGPVFHYPWFVRIDQAIWRVNG